MKTVDQQLYDYIEDNYGYELTTGNGITISTLGVDNLLAEYAWVDTEEAYLSVSFYCGEKRFVNTLGIRNVHDINALTPDKLIELYNEGLAKMVCFVTFDRTYCMSFQKLGINIVAENERAVKHTVPVNEILETPEQFIAYTRRYYKLMECNEPAYRTGRN